jgi:hypothetical protein
MADRQLSRNSAHNGLAPRGVAGALTGKQIILRILRRLFVGVAILLALVYASDFVVLRIRMAANRNPTGTVTVRPVYEVPQKSHRTEYLLGDFQERTCVHALFPHLGYSPCWYLTNHKEQHISM